jgi:glutaconyl-CoA/methylmalonyl-CoA decarboxylase subunit gamma
VRRYTVEVDGTPFSIDVTETAADRFEVRVDGRVFQASLASEEDLPGADISPEMVSADDLRVAPSPARQAPGAPAGGRTPLSPSGLPVRPPSGTPGVTTPGAPTDVLAAPMPGVILEVHVAPGARLHRGDPVLVLEAMKMRNTIRAPHAGVVVSVEVEAGQPVGPGDPLVRLGAAPG